MIARITRILLLAQVLLAFGLAWMLHWQWQIALPWALLTAFGSVVLLRLLITANNFLLAHFYSSATPARFHLRPMQALRLLQDEFIATAVSSSWSMPFYAFRQCPAPHGGMLPVLLVHGYACNSGYWRSMSRALHTAQISHHALDLEPVGASIDAYADAIRAAIETLRRETGSAQVIVLAHSMGGLAVRASLRAHGQSGVAAVITLGTPHHGTGLANFGIGINSREMRWSGRRGVGVASGWLQALAAQEDAARRSLFVSLYSHHDNIISPRTSSHMADAKNIEFHGIGHVALAQHAQIQARVIAEIGLISGRQ